MFKKIMAILLGERSGYVSSADRFLADLRVQYPEKSASQQAEITQYEKIGCLRDGFRHSENVQ